MAIPNLSATSPTGVFPFHIFTSFAESMVYPMLATQYHDGTQERSLVTDGVNPPDSIRTWKVQLRLVPSALATMKTFYESHYGPLNSFYWYNPFEPASGQPVGSNFDPTGVSTQGRYTVKFLTQQWEDATDTARSNVNLEFFEVA